MYFFKVGVFFLFSLGVWLAQPWCLYRIAGLQLMREQGAAATEEGREPESAGRCSHWICCRSGLRASRCRAPASKPSLERMSGLFDNWLRGVLQTFINFKSVWVQNATCSYSSAYYYSKWYLEAELFSSLLSIKDMVSLFFQLSLFYFLITSVFVWIVTLHFISQVALNQAKSREATVPSPVK